MRIDEILADVDEIKPNTYDDNVKLRWLSELDGKIFDQIILTHEHEVPEEGELTFEPYQSLSEDLLVPFPYTDLYRHYLFAMIDYSNGETDRYQNSMVMFNASYQEFTNWYNRTHKPISKPLKIF